MAANLDEVVGESLATLMRHHAEVRGDSPAITLDADEVLTFAQLDARANSLAHHLKDLGVTTDQYVTIAEPNSFEFFIACMACWKIGAVPQPVSWRLPAGELDAIVELADSAAVIGVEHEDRPSITTILKQPSNPTTRHSPTLWRRLGKPPHRVGRLADQS